jgi:glycerol kinase
LTTVAFDFGEGNTMYALEGSIAVAGSSVKFLVDNFGFMVFWLLELSTPG